MSNKKELKKKMKINCNLKKRSKDQLLRDKESSQSLQSKEKNQPKIPKNPLAGGPRRI